MHTTNPQTDFSSAAFKAPFDFIRLRKSVGERVKIELKDLDVRTVQDKRLLIENANLTINQGDHVALIGPNGSGKSSLFRVLRGLTSEGNGHATITMPQDAETFVASQEIRKATMTLPGLLAYPDPAENYSHEAMEQALIEADLDIALEHLPENAVNPERLYTILKPYLDQVMKPFNGQVSAACAKDFEHSFHEALEKTLQMPEPLQDHFTPAHKAALVKLIMDDVKEQLKYDPANEQRLVLFTSYTAKKCAKTLTDHGRSLIDARLLQGQRMTLSGGQQQRLVFASAYLHADQSDLFLLDEPTLALKGDTAHEMIERLFEKTKGKTVIAIIHDTSLLKHFTHVMELHTDKRLTLTKLENGHAPSARPEQHHLDL